MFYTLSVVGLAVLVLLAINRKLDSRPGTSRRRRPSTTDTPRRVIRQSPKTVSRRSVPKKKVIKKVAKKVTASRKPISTPTQCPRRIVPKPVPAPAAEETGSPRDVYRTVRFLFTEQERRFFGVLKAALREHPKWIVCPKVRIADFIKGLRGADYDFLNGRHVDFLVCTRDYYNPMLGIELDDPTHDKPKIVERDLTVDAIYATANFPILHIATAEQYDLDALAALVLDALQNAPHWRTRSHHHI